MSSVKDKSFSRSRRDMLTRVATRIEGALEVIAAIPCPERQEFWLAEISPVVAEWRLLAADEGLLGDQDESCRMGALSPLVLAGGAIAGVAALAWHFSSFESRASRALKRAVTEIDRTEILGINGRALARDFERDCGFGELTGDLACGARSALAYTGKLAAAFAGFALIGIVVAKGTEAMKTRAG